MKTDTEREEGWTGGAVGETIFVLADILDRALLSERRIGTGAAFSFISPPSPSAGTDLTISF